MFLTWLNFVSGKFFTLQLLPLSFKILAKISEFLASHCIMICNTKYNTSCFFSDCRCFFKSLEQYTLMISTQQVISHDDSTHVRTAQ